VHRTRFLLRLVPYTVMIDRTGMVFTRGLFFSCPKKLDFVCCTPDSAWEKPFCICSCSLEKPTATDWILLGPGTTTQLCFFSFVTRLHFYVVLLHFCFLVPTKNGSQRASGTPRRKGFIWPTQGYLYKAFCPWCP